MMCFWVYNIGTCIPMPQKHPEISRFLCLYSLLFSCVYKLLFNHLMTLVLTKQWQMKRNVFVYFLLFLVIFGCIWFAWKMLTFLRYYLAWSRLLYMWPLFLLWWMKMGFSTRTKQFELEKYTYIAMQPTAHVLLPFFVYQSVLFTFVNWFPLSMMSSVALETGRIVATKVATFSKSTNKLQRYYVNNALSLCVCFFFSFHFDLFGLYEICIEGYFLRTTYRLPHTHMPFYGNEEND